MCQSRVCTIIIRPQARCYPENEIERRVKAREEAKEEKKDKTHIRYWNVLECKGIIPLKEAKKS